eukprot:scaffold253977_cov27-Tisochrysis_lutea.AAC.2
MQKIARDASMTPSSESKSKATYALDWPKRTPVPWMWASTARTTTTSPTCSAIRFGHSRPGLGG